MTKWLAGVVSLVCVVGCSGPGGSGGFDGPRFDLQEPPALESVIALPGQQVTGVTVSGDGRVFVCFPYWSQDHGVAVAEVGSDGYMQPYPNPRWNQWRVDGDRPAESHFVCAQSVVADGRGSLWVLDPASPFLENTVPGGPKLVQIDLGSDEVTRVYRFDEQAAPQNSYLNDVRIDHDRRRAYITDSGSPALVVLDLDSGRAVRVLEDHMSTRAEDIQLTIGGEAWVGPGGQTPAVHADGIALSPDGQWVYYKALTGRTLYRVPAAMLAGVLDNDAAEGLADAVEDLGQTVACDGMVMDGNGWLYLTALEQDAILALQPGTGGPLRTLVADPRLQWPDTLAIGPGGGLYITTAQIHLQPRFNDGMDMVTAPYRVWFVDARLEPNW